MTQDSRHVPWRLRQPRVRVGAQDQVTEIRGHAHSGRLHHRVHGHGGRGIRELEAGWCRCSRFPRHRWQRARLQRMADGGRAYLHGERACRRAPAKSAEPNSHRSWMPKGHVWDGGVVTQEPTESTRGREDVRLRGMRPDQDRGNRQAPADRAGTEPAGTATDPAGRRSANPGLRSGRRAGQATPDGATACLHSSACPLSPCCSSLRV